MDLCSVSGVHALPGSALTTSPINLAPNFFSALGRGARAPSAPPGYAYAVNESSLTTVAIDAVRMSDGRLLHAAGSATENASFP